MLNAFNGQNGAIKFIEDYGSMILEVKKAAEESTKGTIAWKTTDTACTSNSK